MTERRHRSLRGDPLIWLGIRKIGNGPASPLLRTHTEGGLAATRPEPGSLSRCLWALHPPLGPVGPRGKKAREGTQPGASLQLLSGHSTANACWPPGKRPVDGHRCYCHWTGLVFWRIEAGRVVRRGHSNSSTVVTDLKFQAWPCHLLPGRLWAAHFTCLSPNSLHKMRNLHMVVT